MLKNQAPIRYRVSVFNALLKNASGRPKQSSFFHAITPPFSQGFIYEAIITYFSKKPYNIAYTTIYGYVKSIAVDNSIK